MILSEKPIEESIKEGFLAFFIEKLSQNSIDVCLLVGFSILSLFDS